MPDITLGRRAALVVHTRAGLFVPLKAKFAAVV